MSFSGKRINDKENRERPFHITEEPFPCLLLFFRKPLESRSGRKGFTIPLHRLSYRNDLEINTTQGRYLLPRKAMDPAQIAAFQREFTRLKAARQKAKK